MSDGTSTQAIQNAPELSGLLRGQRQIQDIKHEINIQNRMLKEGSALYSDLKAQLAAKATAHQALAQQAGTLTSAEIKAQLAAKAVAQQSLAASLAASVNSVRQVSANTMTTVADTNVDQTMLPPHVHTSTEHTLPSLASTLSSLQNALRTGGYKPSVHVTSATSMTSHIHQLLTTVNRAPESPQPKPPKSLPTLLSSLKSPVKSSPGSIIEVNNTNLTMIPDPIPSPNNSTTTQTDTEKIQAIQKLQFHDFPLTTASLIKFPNPTVMSQPSLLTPQNLNKSPIHSEESKSPTIQIIRENSESSGTMTLEMKESPPRPTRPSIISTVTEGNIVTVSLTSDKSIIHSAPSATKVHTSGSAAIKPVVSAPMETLGKVNSLLESSPVLQRTVTTIVTPSNTVSYSVSKAVETSPKKTTITVTSSSHTTVSKSNKATSAATTSYTATPKSVLSTVAATRTRRIRTPKQYDL